jgi:hypothetical protein
MACRVAFPVEVSLHLAYILELFSLLDWTQDYITI